MQTGALKLTIESRLENVALIGMALHRIGLEAGLGEQGAFEVEVCAVEAVNNSVKHAYGGRPGNLVEVEVELGPQCLTIRVSDSGRALPAQLLRRRRGQIEAPNRLRDNGRGLLIIHSLMDRVVYESKAGTNVMTLCRSLAAPARPGRACRSCTKG